jgi:tetratricopeptide (TPR) repeat protein
VGAVSPEIADPKIIAYRNKALELDPDFADIHKMDAGIAFLTEWNWEKAEKEYIKAIALNPNDAGSRVLYAQLLCCLQRPGEALTQGQLAIELDPGNPQVQVWYSGILLGLGDYEAALTIGENLVATKQDHAFGNSIIEMAAFLCKDYEKSFKAAKHLLPLEEDAIKEIEAIFDKQGFVAAYEEITNQMELLVQNGHHISPYDMAIRYIYADQPDKAMDWIEKAFEIHDHQMPYIASGFQHLDTLYENARLIAILEKMNLPVPED